MTKALGSAYVLYERQLNADRRLSAFDHSTQQRLHGVSTLADAHTFVVNIE